jgi:hypothetical protein
MGLETLSPTRHRCPKCGRVYSGAPYDNVLYARVHSGNLRGARDCARVWQLTADEKWARRAAEVLLGYAERYLDYPYHNAHHLPPTHRYARRSGARICPQTLGEASLTACYVAPAYDLIGGWRGLRPADHRAIREKLVRPMLENIDMNRAENNWQSWHNAAMFSGGAVLREARWMDRALHSKKYGFYRQMRDMVTDEGMWFENSWGYHYYTLSAMFEIAEAARRAGLSLWREKPLRRMCEAPIRYRLPGGDLPRNGDSTAQRVDFSGGLRRIYEAAWSAYRSEEIAALLPGAPDWSSVMHGRPTGGKRPAVKKSPGSALFPGAGHALLRRPRTDSAALLNFGTYTGFHSHFDMLSFIYYGRGELLGIDPGRADSQAYCLPIHPDWYKNTLSHNAVVVDGRCQQTKVGARGELLLCEDAPEYSAAAARGDVAYRGVRHARLLVLFDDYLLVVDALEARRPRSFDWFYHNNVGRVRAPRGARKVNVARRGRGYEYIRDSRALKTRGGARLCFSGRVESRVTLAGGQSTELVTGHGPFGSVLTRSPLVVARRRGKRVAFAAALEPLEGGRKPRIGSVNCERRGGTLVVSVARRGGGDRVAFDPRGKLEVERRR